jgi:hypothetical protein
MGIISRLAATIIGRSIQLPQELLAKYPDLASASYRRGGLPVRIAGWAMGMPSVEAITLWRTVFLGPDTAISAALLLHELRHVHQFLERRTFPVSYLWQSLRYGYTRNAYEVDARKYSAFRLSQDSPRKDV